jgi:hypothetical protein
MSTGTKGICLGDIVRCKHTGFTGRVISRTQWINNCDRFMVQPTDLDKDGKIRDYHSFDVMDLEIVTKKDPPEPPVKHGGPRDDPRRPE